MQSVIFDSHMHTPFCRHAEGLPGDYAAHAEERGLRGIVITCHTPLPGRIDAAVRMSEDELENYTALVQAASNEWHGKIDVLLGLESEFIPGLEREVERIHRRAPFQYILGSVHAGVPEYMERYFHDDIREFHITYFDHLARAAESGLFDALSHPDIVKNCFPLDWRPEELQDEIRRALERISKTQTAMELNTSGLLKAVPEMNPGRFMLREMSRLGIPVVLGSDAHHPSRVADRFEEALSILEEEGYRKVVCFKGRQRIDVDISSAKATLIPPGKGRDKVEG